MWWACLLVQTTRLSCQELVTPPPSCGTSATACAGSRSPATCPTSTPSVWVLKRPAARKETFLKTPYCLFKPLLFFFFFFSLCSFSPMGTHLARAQMTPPAGCLICVPTRSWWCTATTTLSVASLLWPSPRAGACCWPDTTTSTATYGTLLKESEQVCNWCLVIVTKTK